MEEQKTFRQVLASKNVFITAFLFLLITIAYTFFAEERRNETAEANNMVVCTMEAKMCPDGSYVGRTGPKCEFTACPDGIEAYSSIDYGFSFNYKNQYLLSSKELGNAERSHYLISLINRRDAVDIQNASEGPTAITFDIFRNLENDSVEKWIRGNNNSNFKLSKSQKIKKGLISGKDVYVYKWDGLYQGGSVVFAHKDNIVMVSVTYNSRDDEITRDFFDLVENIKFTK